MIRWLARLSDVGATKLALVFGFNLTIWVFFVVPLLAEFFPVQVQAKVFYYASGWIQLFALPLMVYVSNKIQRESDKQDARQTEMLAELRRNEQRQTELLDEVRQTARANGQIAREVRQLITQNPPGPD